MNEYTVYFEIYGKKMKTTVSASSVSEAHEKIRQKIKFNRTEKKNYDPVNHLKNIFGIN